jgi:hypothetical protein
MELHQAAKLIYINWTGVKFGALKSGDEPGIAPGSKASRHQFLVRSQLSSSELCHAIAARYIVLTTKDINKLKPVQLKLVVISDSGLRISSVTVRSGCGTCRELWRDRRPTALA